MICMPLIRLHAASIGINFELMMTTGSYDSIGTRISSGNVAHEALD